VTTQVPVYTPQYWVIDAVDECSKYAEMFTLLKGVRSRFPLRIFITSRKLPDMNKLLRQLDDCTVCVIEIPRADTMKDIELLVRNRIDYLPVENEMEKDKLRQDILSKSDASFLWVRLVMDELECVYGYESIISVLHDIPEGMMSYYRRMVADMALNKREKHIAKCILSWVVTAVRPLSTSELSEALKLDIDVQLSSARAAIEGLCGQLVSVDKHTDLIYIVHATAREFLFSDDAGEFKISRSESHERIGLTCLQLLISPVMQPPRHRSLVGQKRPEQRSSPLLEYAIDQFSEHLYSASSESDDLLVALRRFLSTTVLTWIERIVATGVLHRLIRAARNLRGYLDMRAKYHRPLNRQVKVVEDWTTDLSRLVMKFSAALTMQPTSIYFLIPPLCPMGTAIYQQFGRIPHGLICSGLSNIDWDDCVATIHFENESTATITCDSHLIAVGYESGNIHLYNHGSCQKDQVIKHDSQADVLLLDPLGLFIASAGTRYLTVWDLKGKLLWNKRLRSRCILLTCSSSFIMGVTTSGRAFKWDIATGEQLQEHRYPNQSPEPRSGSPTYLPQAPFAASVSPGLELLALAYGAGPICIYELQANTLVAWAVEGSSRIVSQLVFNPNPELNLLLVAYDDSLLALYDTWSGARVRDRPSPNNAVLTSLSCSPDGRSFGTVDIFGNLQILDFESLTVLYRVLTPRQSFRILNFTSDSFSLVDATQNEMRIWSPSALVRKRVEEEASMSDQAEVLPIAEGQFESFQSSKIRSMVAHQVHSAVFAGNHNGDVILFDSDNGQGMGILYSHPNAMVRCLAVTSNAIASGDINAAVQVWHLDTSRPHNIKADKLLFQAPFSAAICQMLFDLAGEHLLVSTTDADYVYNIKSGTLLGSLTFGDDRETWKWIVLPDARYAHHFTLISNWKLVTYAAATFPTILNQSYVHLNYNTPDGICKVGIDSAVVYPEIMSLVLEIRQQNGYLASSAVLMFKLPSFQEDSVTVDIQPTRILSADLCLHFLGLSQTDRKLVFLHKTSWVSSIDFVSLESLHYTQHFFVPSELITDSNNVRPIQTFNDNFVFALHDKLVVIKNGLKFQGLKSLG
jgi:WD40 repeat protein